MEHGLQDIADALGLSVSTVSRVINQKSTVKESTRKRVMEYLDSCGYSPNFLARSLKTNRTKTIGVVVPDITESLFGNVIKGINDELDRWGYTAVICDSDESADKEKKHLRYLQDIRVDGCIVALVSPFQETIRNFAGEKRPIVLIDNIFPCEGICDSVAIDNFRAGYEGTKFLIEKGHTKIGIITGSNDQPTGSERLRGYLAAMQEYGLAAESGFVQMGDYKETSGYVAMQRFLEQSPEITAVYATSSKMTFGAARLLRERGLSYGDVALLGFDIKDEMGMIVPGITSIVQSGREIGKQAALVLMDHLEKQIQEKQNICAPFKIVERESV